MLYPRRPGNALSSTAWSSGGLELSFTLSEVGWGTWSVRTLYPCNQKMHDIRDRFQVLPDRIPLQEMILFLARSLRIHPKCPVKLDFSASHHPNRVFHLCFKNNLDFEVDLRWFGPSEFPKNVFLVDLSSFTGYLNILGRFLIELNMP